MPKRRDEDQEMWDDHYSDPSRGPDDFESVWNRWQDKKPDEREG